MKANRNQSINIIYEASFNEALYNNTATIPKTYCFCFSVLESLLFGFPKSRTFGGFAGAGISQVFTGIRQVPFLSPSQQRQNTEACLRY